MTASDLQPGAATLKIEIVWEKPGGVRRVLAAGQSVLAGLLDEQPEGYGRVAVVVRQRRGPRAEVLRVDSTAGSVGALAERIDGDLQRLSEQEFLAEWKG